MSGCPAPEQLLRLLTEDLTAAEQQALECHLESCPHCQQVLDEHTSVTLVGGGAPARPVLPEVADDTLAPPDLPPLDTDFRRQLQRRLQTWEHAQQPLAGPELPAPPDYEILAEVGRGGMGVVYRARQVALNRVVALKMVLAGAWASSEQRLRFHLEAEMAARVRHPNVVQVYEIGTHRGQPWLALEWVDGGSLSEQLRGARQPPRAAAELIEALARGAHAAHSQGVIHRDLKPANVLLAVVRCPLPVVREKKDGGSLLTMDNRQRTTIPKIADFGLARPVHGDPGLTETGDVLGTPEYMAPEQAAGRRQEVGIAADVYALGAILYELLAGRPPFRGDTVFDTLQQVVDREPASPRQLQSRVPRDLDIICLKCLQKDPRHRYPSAAALADDLHRFLQGEPIQARPAGELERVVKWARRRPAVAGLLAAVVVTLLAASGLSTYLEMKARARAVQAETQEREANAARETARIAREKSDRQSAELLLDRGVELAHGGKVPEGLHWMLAALQTSPDPDFQRVARTYLTFWGARAPVLHDWLDAPTGHGAGAFSPDGKLFVTAGRTGTSPSEKQITLQFWDPHRGERLGDPIRSEDVGIDTLSFSPDGLLLLAASGNAQEHQNRPGWASRWSVPERRFLGRSLGHLQHVLGALWAPDGRRFLTTSADHTLRWWRADTGQPIGPPLPYAGRASRCSPNGRWLLGSRDQARVEVLASDTGAVVHSIATGLTTLHSLAWAPDGRSFVAAGMRGSKGLVQQQPWDPVAGAPLGAPQELPAPSMSAAFLADGRAVSLGDGTFSPDGELFATHDEGWQFWRLPQDRSLTAGELPLRGPTYSSPSGVLRACFNPDAARVWVVASNRRLVQAWDLAQGLPVGPALPQQEIFGRLRMATTRDGARVVTVPPDPSRHLSPARIWDAHNAQTVGAPLTQQNSVLAVAISPNGTTVATAGHFHTVDLWDLRTGRHLVQLPQNDMVLDVAFSSDGRMLASATYGREARVWDIPSGPTGTAGTYRLRQVLAHDEPVHRTLFSLDGTRLMTLGDKAAHLWQVNTGERLATMPSYQPVTEGRIHIDPQLLLSPDGAVLLTSSGYGSFRLWDAATGRPLGPPTPSSDIQLSCFAFSPDSRFVLAGHQDGTTQLWEVAHFGAAPSRPLTVVQPTAIVGVAFAPDGRSFCTVAADGTIRHWPLPEPLAGSVERITRAVQLSTGLRVDEGRAVVRLTRLQWQELRRQWREQEGDADWRIAPPLDDAEWHDARAHDAEQLGQPFTALWHLDRLLARRSGDWVVHARRARAALDAGRWDLALADELRAAALAPPVPLRDWYGQRLQVCVERRQWAAVLWYLGHLLLTPAGPVAGSK